MTGTERRAIMSVNQTKRERGIGYEEYDDADVHEPRFRFPVEQIKRRVPVSGGICHLRRKADWLSAFCVFFRKNNRMPPVSEREIVL